MDDDLELPDYLDRRKNGITPEPLPANISWRIREPNKIIWPRAAIERVMRLKAKAAKQAKKEKRKKEKAAKWKG